ncbi:hypothetical protein [Rhizobium leguminosarum]|uniref:hypothetical protein n=1 Tax=Rhizobium leguminosarum TaxID=384 RepID=UPI003F9BDE7C
MDISSSKNVVSLDDILKGMASRMPWRVAAKVLVANGGPKARSWEPFKEKLASEKHDIDVDGLSNAFLEHILFGEKASRFYQVAESVLAKARQTFTGKTGVAHFPFSELSEDVNLLSTSKPQLCFIHESDDGMTLVYNSVRAVEKRETVALSALPADARPALSGYKEIIGVKQDMFRAYDVIWLPYAGTIVELRVDFPHGASADASEFAISQALDAFKADSSSSIDEKPVDLFPVIKRIYETADDGRIVEFALHTSTGSFKHEKMRLGDTCLREERYHLGGKTALKGEIELFKLGVRWTVEYGKDDFTNPELFLNGSFRMLHSDGYPLETAIIRNCTGAKDYNFVRAKIDEHLKANDA